MEEGPGGNQVEHFPVLLKNLLAQGLQVKFIFATRWVKWSRSYQDAVEGEVKSHGWSFYLKFFFTPTVSNGIAYQLGYRLVQLQQQ
jgi:hypothetical protein